MRSDWINAVYVKRNEEGAVDCSHPELLEKYRLPIFAGLTITISHMDNAEKLRWSAIVKKNGKIHFDVRSQLSKATIKCNGGRSCCRGCV